jgi:hypothetical protein
MARSVGDTNFSPREERLRAQNAVLKAKAETLKKQLDVKDARIKELRAKKA